MPTKMLCLLRRAPGPLVLCSKNRVLGLRFLASTNRVLEKPLPPRRQIPDTDIIENFLKGSGPGGQKINKTSSAVQLKHIPSGVVVKCQETRSRTQNRKIARRLLAERIEELELGEDSRTALKARIKSKKKASSDKKKRRKYKALSETKDGEEDTIEDDEGEMTEESVKESEEVPEEPEKKG